MTMTEPGKNVDLKPAPVVGEADVPPVPPAHRRSARKRQQMAIWLTRLAVLVIGVSAWHLASGTVVQEFLLPKPAAVIERVVEWITDGTLWFHASQTLESAFYGFGIGAVLAIVAGYLAGVSRFWAAVVEPFISAAWAVPRIAFLPLLIIYVGIGQNLSIVIAAILVFFLLFYNTYYGIREVSQPLIDSVRILGGKRRDVAFRVRLPSALVWIVAGMKVSIPQAFVGVVTAEILASNRGLGFLVGRSAGQFDTTGAFAALLGLLIVGFSLDRIVTAASGRALIWKSPHGRA